MPIDYRESVLTFVRTRGPSLPTQVGKHISMDSMLAGALLAELTEKGQLKISHLKVGGSPLYFAPGQESELVKFVHHLNDKEREATQLLGQYQVLRDTQLPPPIRVALRQAQDFAVPLDVTFNNQKERFWKWFALPDEDARQGIRRMLEPQTPAEPAGHAETAQAPSQAIRPQQNVVRQPREQPGVAVYPAETVAQAQRQEPAQPTKTAEYKEHKPRSKSPAQKVLQQAPLSSFSAASDALPEDTAQQSQARGIAPQETSQKGSQDATLQADQTDPFSVQLHEFFVKNNIKILEQTCVKKKAEYDFVLMLPSTVGELLYYCKAKSKKLVNEGDVSAAFVQGQIRKLPVLFVSPGDLAKKAKELAMRELLSLTYKRLEG